MPDIIFIQDSDTGAINYTQQLHNFLLEIFEEYSTLEKAHTLLNFYENTLSRLTAVDENYINEKRMIKLKSQFTPKLIHLILESDFEYGIDSQVDVFVRNQMKENALATKSWLNDIFVENFSNPTILVGLLRTISRFDYLTIYPEGQTMAVAALSHTNVEVQECGVRAFESWGDLQSLDILENLHVSTAWLQEYIDEVVKDLQKEHHVSIS